MKNRYWILILLCLVAALSACGVSQSTDTSGFQADVPQKRYLISTADQNAISIGIPYFGGEDSWLDKAVVSYLNETVEDIMEQEPELTESLTDVELQNQAELLLKLDYQIPDFSASRISILFTGMLQVKDAAHPTGLCFALNLDLQTQKRIYLYDVCPVDDALYDTFLECACQSLTDKGSTNHTKENAAELFPKEEFLLQIQEETVYQSYFTQDGVGIICPVGHALGDYLRVEIPLGPEE